MEGRRSIWEQFDGLRMVQEYVNNQGPLPSSTLVSEYLAGGVLRLLQSRLWEESVPQAEPVDGSRFAPASLLDPL